MMEKETTVLFAVDRTRSAADLAKGKQYQTSVSASSEYPDDGSKLTNGKVIDSFRQEAGVGYRCPEGLEILLDLSAEEGGVADIAVTLLHAKEQGGGVPAYVRMEGSADGCDFRRLGTVYPPADLSGEGAAELRLKLANTVSVRYIRFTFGQTTDAWLFVGGLHVLRYGNDGVPSYYGAVELPEVTEPAYWPETEPDREVRQNLIAGKIPFVESREKISAAYMTEHFNSLKALSKLTDGVYGTRATCTDEALAHFTRGIARSLYFDLGYTSAVSGASFSFVEERVTAVYAPESISVALSEDGIGWQTVYVNRQLRSCGASSYSRTEAAFGKAYRARFVRITFSIGVHVFCDELQVYGTKAIPADALSIVPEEEEEAAAQQPLGYITKEDFLGVNNTLLSYHCQPGDGEHPESGLVTVEEYLPHVGYYDRDGRLVDTFFDSFLFLPYARFVGAAFSRTLEGWKYYLDDIFYKDRNMDALNTAVGKTAKALSLDDYRCTVFTAILYPWETMGNGSDNEFGDLDGDGQNESFALLENRKKAVKWIMDQEYERFCAGNYENLTFGGYYWFEESLSVTNVEELELVNYASDYAHSLGFKIFWIPYYCASGYSRWKDFGFDLACMQPNYMFQQKNNPSSLRINAEQAQQFGMCVEIEMNDLNALDEVRRYREYLEAGAKYGYMYAVKMYYQGGVPGAYYDAYRSDDPIRRAVYDMTYLYAKEKLEKVTPAYTVEKLSYACSGDPLTVSKFAASEAAFALSLCVSPAHGGLQLNNDGSWTYCPDEGFTGEDRFAVALDFADTKSEPLIVTVKVGK